MLNAPPAPQFHILARVSAGPQSKFCFQLILGYVVPRVLTHLFLYAIVAAIRDRLEAREHDTDRLMFAADLPLLRKTTEVLPNKPYETLDNTRTVKGLKGGGTTTRGNLATGAAVMLEGNPTRRYPGKYTAVQ